MNEETNILLSELVEAVSGSGATLEQLIEAVSRPDWWSVIATFVAAAVAAVITYVLGKRQNELQKQQLKIQERQNELQEEQTRLQEQQNKLQEQQIRVQEYEVFSKMYALVSEVNKLTSNLINIIYYYYTSPTFKRMSKNVLPNIQKDIPRLKQRFYDLSIDFELKLSQDYLAPAYVDLLTDTERLLELFFDLEQEGHLSQMKKNLEIDAVLMAKGKQDATIVIDAIVERIINVKLRESVKNSLIGYTHHRTSVLELEVLTDIKKCIKPDKTAI